MKSRAALKPLLFILIRFFLFSEDVPLDISTYTIEQWDIYSGLCSDSITALYQDSKGFVWIGTYDGVMRFDGQRFMTFDQTNTAGFVGHSANGFLEAEGSLWISSGQGVIRFRDGVFHSFTKEDGLVSPHISSMAADREGRLWLGTNQGLMYFDGTRFRIPLYDGEDPFSGRGISALEHHPDWGLVAACTDGGLYVNCRSEPVLIKETGNRRITTMATMGDGLVAGDRSGGILRLSSSGNLQYEKISKESVRDMCAVGGDLWIITSSELMIINEGRISRVSSSDVNFRMLRSVPKAIELDRTGNVWVGTRSGGLYCLGPSRFKSINALNGLPESTVNSVAEYPEGIFWIGTDAGLFCHDGNGLVRNDLTRYLSGERVKHILAYREKLYVSTLSGKGVVVWDGRGISRIDESAGLPNRVVKKTMVDSRENLWIATSGGLASLSPRGEWSLYHRDTGFIGDEIYDLFEDREGRIWVTTVEDGLVRIEQNGAYQRFSEREGLSGEMVFSVRQDRQGDFWVSTPSGVFLIRRDDSIYPVTFEQGLPYLYAYTVEPLDDRLYFTSVKGFSSASLDQVKETALGYRDAFVIDHYDWDSGLSASPNALSWLFIDSEERIWIPTHRGVDCFLKEPAQEESLLYPPRVTKAVSPDTICLDPERLEYGEALDYLTLHAALPGYKGQPRLEYRLIPYQDFWMTLPESGVANYTKLKRGKYIFQLKSANLSEEAPGFVEVPIRIRPPLPWGYLLTLPALLLISFLILIAKGHPIRSKPDWPGIRDKYALSERELEILKLFSSGMRDKEIAQKANCATSTVSNTLSRIYRKTETGGRSDLILLIHREVKKSTGRVRKSTPRNVTK